MSATDKIQMIKALRSLSKLLGKLGVSGLIAESAAWMDQQEWKRRNPTSNSNKYPRYSYGIGLKDAKDITENYLARKGTAATA